MSEEEISKTIAKYMGWYDEPVNPRIPYEEISFYTKSLDALVPVVEKLNMQTILHKRGSGWHASIHDSNTSHGYSEKSPSKALAMACAEAIKELGE